MISVSSDMILRTVIASALLGILGGALYSLLFGIARLAFGCILKLFKKAYVKQSGAFFENAYDFVFILLLGIFFVLILYAFNDGVFFFLPLFALFTSFILSKRLVGSLFNVKKRN